MWTCVLIVLAFLLTGVAALADDSSPGAERPRLFVLVVFDQLRGDYLSRWEAQFGDGGFRRLQTDGAWYQNCHYPYAGTLTGAGHASLLTGCGPSTHGVVANEWYDRATATSVNCVVSLKHERVPSPLTVTSDVAGKVSPETLNAESFGDVLKQATSSQGRIVSLSFKDRSAILPGGRTPDACYWFEASSGTFVTSTYYGEALHPWVEKFNNERPADKWFGKSWTRLRDDLDYDKLAGPDDVAGEGSGTKQGRTFPHPMTGGLTEPGKEFYTTVYTSPFGNELLLDLANRAIDAEKLGADDVPDMLAISFSSNDAVGHTWGPDSQEVLDVTLRSDLIVKQLLESLDAKVGKGRYVLALSADHGVCRIPEVGVAMGNDAGRVSTKELRKGAEAFLEAQFGDASSDKARWIEALSNGWFYLNQATLRKQGAPSVQAEFALGEWLRRQTGIAAVYTRQQLQDGIAANDVMGQRVVRSYYPDRCGDVLIVLKPHWLLGDYTTGTTHGSPYGYDTYVPLIVYGPKVVPGTRAERISPMAIAPIFAHALGTRPPANSNTPLPAGLFNESTSR